MNFAQRKTGFLTPQPRKFSSITVGPPEKSKLSSSMKEEGTRPSVSIASQRKTGRDNKFAFSGSSQEQTIPLDIKQQTLTMGSNKMDFSSQEITDFAILKQHGTIKEIDFVDLSNNKIEVIFPKDIDDLAVNFGWKSAIKTITLANNLLRTIPREISLLQNLRILNLQNNKLIALPTEIKLLRYLEKLNVEDNLLLRLPYELSELFHLKSLMISGNPLNQPPAEIRSKNTAIVLCWLSCHRRGVLLTLKKDGQGVTLQLKNSCSQKRFILPLFSELRQFQEQNLMLRSSFTTDDQHLPSVSVFHALLPDSLEHKRQSIRKSRILSLHPLERSFQGSSYRTTPANSFDDNLLLSHYSIPRENPKNNILTAHEIQKWRGESEEIQLRIIRCGLDFSRIRSPSTPLSVFFRNAILQLNEGQSNKDEGRSVQKAKIQEEILESRIMDFQNDKRRCSDHLFILQQQRGKPKSSLSFTLQATSDNVSEKHESPELTGYFDKNRKSNTKVFRQMRSMENLRSTKKSSPINVPAPAPQGIYYRDKEVGKQLSKELKDEAEAEFLRRFANVITLDDYLFLKNTPRKLYRALPDIPILPMNSTDLIEQSPKKAGLFPVIPIICSPIHSLLEVSAMAAPIKTKSKQPKSCLRNRLSNSITSTFSIRRKSCKPKKEVQISTETSPMLSPRDSPDTSPSSSPQTSPRSESIVSSLGDSEIISTSPAEPSLVPPSEIIIEPPPEIPNDPPNEQPVLDKQNEPLAMLSGPNDTSDGNGKGEVVEFNEVMFGQSTSTYPFNPTANQREGEPICDFFCLVPYQNRIIVGIADGCNWGNKPRFAARAAISAFIQFLHRNIMNETSLKGVGQLLLRACCIAHTSIMNQGQPWELGTTTLLGGVLLQFRHSTIPSFFGVTYPSPEWIFVSVSVGDCKAFHYSRKSKQITEITKGNRRISNNDPCDPGGRLGPYSSEDGPDLRNLDLYTTICHEGDFIMLMTDGVHDNLDPEILGVAPSQLFLNSEHDLWTALNADEIALVKERFTQRLLAEMFATFDEKDLSPKNITSRLVDHCMNTTEKSRKMMESTVHMHQPKSYEQFPGKMDHLTCVTFRVGHIANTAAEYVNM